MILSICWLHRYWIGPGSFASLLLFFMMELSFSEHIVWHANICKCYFGKSAHYIANYPCIPDGQPFNLLWRSIQIKASFNLLYLTFNAFLCMIRILMQVLLCIMDLHFSTKFLRLYQTTTGFNRVQVWTYDISCTKFSLGDWSATKSYSILCSEWYQLAQSRR
jgi:hypothetical protein